MAIVSESVAHILFHVRAVAGTSAGATDRAQLVEGALAPFASDPRDLDHVQLATEVLAQLPGSPNARKARDLMQYVINSGWSDLISAITDYVVNNLLPEDDR